MKQPIVTSFFITLLALASHAIGQSSIALSEAEQAVVKLYGEGGIQGIEGYQTGLLVALGSGFSSEGLILTVDSPTIGNGEMVAVLANGDRYSASLLSTDPLADLALLKIEIENDELVCFALENPSSYPALTGASTYTLSNCFNIASGDEPITRQRMTIAIEGEVRFNRLYGQTRLQKVLLLDSVTSNPGAAGGALVDREGKLLGMIGKESRSGPNDTWLNYALPMNTLNDSVELMLEGRDRIGNQVVKLRKARQPGALYQETGLVLVRPIGNRTPPFVEYVHPDSDADRAGIVFDDLLISIQGIPVGSTTLAEEILLQLMESNEKIQIVLLRNNELMVVLWSQD